MITATQQGPRQFDTPVSFEKYQIPKFPPAQVRVEVRAQYYGLTKFLKVNEYGYEIIKLVNVNNWEKLCEFHEIIRLNHNTFDETPQKKEIDAALYHVHPNLYQWLIKMKDKEENKVKKEKLKKGFIYQVLCLDYSFAKQCARTTHKPDSPFLSKFNWRNLTKISDVRDYKPSIKLQYEPLPKTDITILREELENLRKELEDSDSDTSVSDTELGETETRALEAEKESRAKKRKSRCSASDTLNSAPASKKRRAQIIETDSDSDADNALVKRGNGKGIETDVNNVTASDTKNLRTTLNEKQPTGQTSRPISPQVPAIVIKRQKIHEVVELDEDVDQLLEQAIDKKLGLPTKSTFKEKKTPEASVSAADNPKFHLCYEKQLLACLDELKKLRQHNIFLQENIKILKFINIELYTNSVESKNAYLELKEEHEEMKKEYDENFKKHMKNYEGLKAQVSEIEEMVYLDNKESLEAQKEHLKLREEHLQLQEKHLKLQKDHSELQKEHSSVVEELEGFAQETNRYIEVASKLEKIQLKLVQDLKATQENEQKKDKTIEELQRKVQLLSDENLKIKKERSQANNKFEEAFGNYSRVKDKRDEIDQELHRSKEDNDKLQKEINRLQNELLKFKSFFGPAYWPDLKHL